MYTSILPGIYCENVWLSEIYEDTALLQTGPWEKCITNRRSYVSKPSYKK